MFDRRIFSFDVGPFSVDLVFVAVGDIGSVRPGVWSSDGEECYEGGQRLASNHKQAKESYQPPGICFLDSHIYECLRNLSDHSISGSR